MKIKCRKPGLEHSPFMLWISHPNQWTTDQMYYLTIPTSFKHHINCFLFRFQIFYYHYHYYYHYKLTLSFNYKESCDDNSYMSLNKYFCVSSWYYIILSFKQFKAIHSVLSQLRQVAQNQFHTTYTGGRGGICLSGFAVCVKNGVGGEVCEVCEDVDNKVSGFRYHIWFWISAHKMFI